MLDGYEIPAHVPPELVYDYNFFTAPVGKTYPQAEVARHLQATAPDIFYTPRNGGHWATFRYDEAVEITKTFELFSSNPKFDTGRPQFPRHAPVEYDPPEHTEFRQVINPAFSPKAVRALDSGIEQYAKELIGTIASKGQCEFITELAQLYSVAIFMRMARAPMTDREMLIGFSNTYFRNPDMAIRAQARAQLAGYLTQLIASRRGDLGDDLISMVLTSRLPDRDLTDLEQLAMVSVIFLGSLDTVVAMLSFLIYYLGKNPEVYRQFADKTAKIDRPLEELIRMHGINNTRRGVTRDCEFRGVPFRAEDRMLLLRPLIGYDDRKNPDPYTVDLDRPNPVHLAFGIGAHFCAGTNLARLEMKHFLREWIAAIPEFSVIESNMIGGHVWMPEHLHLSWA